MSHKATNWLASLDPALLGHSEFRVLFHLCDCHNPSAGCFPTQAYLMANADASNGTVNNVLNSLERKGLIQRHRERDGTSRRQKPTRYVLGFEIKKDDKEVGEPTPKNGVGKGPEPTPKNGVGAVSNSEADPSPIQRPTRLQPTGEEPVKNQIINQACRQEPSKNPIVQRSANDAVERFREGRAEAFEDLQPWIVNHIIAANLLTAAELQRAGLC